MMSIRKFFRRLFRTVIEVHYHKNVEIMSVQYSNGDVKLYKGSGTVWNNYPTMTRCSTSTEVVLCDYWMYLVEHGNPWPHAHIVNKVAKALEG